MTPQEKEKWLKENKRPETFYEKLTTLPSTIIFFKNGFIQAVFGVFIFVFIVNYFFFIGRIRNEP